MKQLPLINYARLRGWNPPTSDEELAYKTTARGMAALVRTYLLDKRVCFVPEVQRSPKIPNNKECEAHSSSQDYKDEINKAYPTWSTTKEEGWWAEFWLKPRQA
jgi:hypothetical protein